MGTWAQDIAINSLWHNNTAGEDPTEASGGAVPANPINGAVAINTADGKMWVKVTNGGLSGWEEVTGSGGGGGGGMTSFTLAGDSGTNQTISDGNTLTIAGGTGLASVGSNTDTLTLNIDSTVTTLTGNQTLTNKTLTTPTIAATGWTTANHAHAANNSGGTLNASAIGAGVLGVARGGTGAGTFTDGYVLLGSGTSAITALNVTAKGSLLVGDGSGDPQALAVGGTNNHILMVDSSETTGIKWAANPSSAVTALNNATVNEIVTVGSTTTELDAQADLTFIEDPGNNVNVKMLQGYGYAFLETNMGGDFLQVMAAPSIGSSWIWKFPAAIGTAGQVLEIDSVTNNIANLGWVTTSSSDSQHSHSGKGYSLGVYQTGGGLDWDTEGTSTSDFGNGAGVTSSLMWSAGGGTNQAGALRPEINEVTSGKSNGILDLGDEQRSFGKVYWVHKSAGVRGNGGQTDQSGSTNEIIHTIANSLNASPIGGTYVIHMMGANSAFNTLAAIYAKTAIRAQPSTAGGAYENFALNIQGGGSTTDPTNLKGNLQPDSTTTSSNGYLGISTKQFRGLYSGFVSLATDGSYSAPAITWTSDPDTGIYRAAANALGFATGGYYRYYIHSDGVSYFYNGIRQQAGGYIFGGNTLTNNTNKEFDIASYHYVTDEDRLLMIQGYSTTSGGYVTIGGGNAGAPNSQYLNNATNVAINVAANNTTPANDNAIKHFNFSTTSLSIPDGVELDLNSDDAIRGIRFKSSGNGINTSFAGDNNGEGEVKLYVKDNYIVIAHQGDETPAKIHYLYYDMRGGVWGNATNTHWLRSETEPS